MGIARDRIKDYAVQLDNRAQPSQLHARAWRRLDRDFSCAGYITFPPRLNQSNVRMKTLPADIGITVVYEPEQSPILE